MSGLDSCSIQSEVVHIDAEVCNQTWACNVLVPQEQTVAQPFIILTSWRCNAPAKKLLLIHTLPALDCST